MVSESECTCVQQSAKIALEARTLRRPGKGFSSAIIYMILQKSGSHLPSRILNGEHVINELTLAKMLGNANDRTMIGIALRGEVGAKLIDSIGFCAACQKEIQPQRLQVTTESLLARKQQEIQIIFTRHPEVFSAKVATWTDKAGSGLATLVERSKTVFSAELTLTDGKCISFVTARPSRCPVSEFEGKVAEFQSSTALWNRIKNRRFIESTRDHDIQVFHEEEGKTEFERLIRKRYAGVRNISEKCLQVRLLVASDVVPEAREQFGRHCVDRNRYVCEVTTIVPGENGKAGPVMNIEHITLRDLNESPNKRSPFDVMRKQFFDIQQRYIQPVKDFEWFMNQNSLRDKPRRKVFYTIAGGARCGGYPWELNRPTQKPPEGLRYFNELSGEQGYLSLVEIYDQHDGQTELKWCLTLDRCFRDSMGNLLPDEYNNLYSLATRYRCDVGTPVQVRRGGKRYSQVRKVLAYCHGDYQVMQAMDTLAKRATFDQQCPPGDRDNRTEYRNYCAKDSCVEKLSAIAHERDIILIQPEHGTIAWDLMIGADHLSVSEWVLQLYEKSAKSNGFQDAIPAIFSEKGRQDSRNTNTPE